MLVSMTAMASDRSTSHTDAITIPIGQSLEYPPRKRFPLANLWDILLSSAPKLLGCSAYDLEQWSEWKSIKH